MIKKILLAAAATTVLAGNAALAADLGVSVHVTEPGVYGRVDIGRVPAPPALIYAQPMVVAPQPVVIERSPIYLHVPPGHAKNWNKHCKRYNACAQPVYFVQENWYQQNVVRRQAVYQDHVHSHGKSKDKHDKHDKHGKGHGKHGD